MVRVDTDGQIIDDSKLVQIGDQAYSKGKVRVGLVMPASAIEGNVIYAGATPVSSFSGEYATNGEHSILLRSAGQQERLNLRSRVWIIRPQRFD